MWIFGDGAGTTLQTATVVVFIACLIAGFMFYRDLQILKSQCKALCNHRKNGNAANVIMSGKSKRGHLKSHQH